jgi:putative membrane protein
METGGIAAKKGTTKEIREFGATPPKDFAMAKDHAAALRTLRATSGKAFDRAFLEHEVAYHKAVLDAMSSTLLPALQNQEARALVTKVAPAFKAHMDAAQNLLDKQGK